MIQVLKKSIYPAMAGLALISGCGGGSSPVATAEKVVEQPQQVVEGVVAVHGLSARLLAGNSVALTISPESGSPATAFCARTDLIKPAAGDACFKTDKSQTVSTLGSDTNATLVKVWAKDSADGVTAYAALAVPGKTCSAQAYAASTASSLPTACLITNKGELVMALENEKTPITVKNFLRYLNAGFYSGTYFHRVLPNSVVQGGGYEYVNGLYRSKSLGYAAIELEKTTVTHLSNIQKSVAMARTSVANSATSGFFINVRDNSSSYDTTSTSDGYAVFANIIYEQASTLQNLNVQSVGSGTGDLSGSSDVPTTPLALQWAYQIK